MAKNLVKRIKKRAELEFKTLFFRSTTIHGIKLKIDRRQFSKKMKMRLHRGKFELPEYELFNDKLEGHERILEMGAGIGFISIAMAKKLKPYSLFCYEVNPDLVGIIKHNQHQNRVRFHVYDHFLTTDSMQVGKEVPFYVSKQFYSSSFEKFPGYTKVLHKRARSLNRAISINKIDMLVMDIEGYEYNLLDNWAIPERIKKFCIEIHPYKVEDSFDVTEFLEMQGFTVDESYKENYVLYAYR